MSLYANIRITAIDKFSAVFRRMNRHIKVAARQMSKAQDKANKSFSVAANMNQAAMQVGRFNQVSRRILFAPIKAFAEFEQGMAKVKSLTQGITDNEFTMLSNKAKEIGLNTKWTATQITEGLGFLGIAGFSPQEQVKTIGPLANLAIAADMPLDRTSDILSDLMKMFGKTADQASDMSDVLTTTFVNSNTTLETLFSTMRFVGAETKSLGLTFRQTSAMAAVLGSAGLKGTMAGTGLAQMLNNLVAPRGRRKKAMEALNIDIKDQKTGGLKDPMLIFVDIIEKMAGKDLLDRKKALGEIFTRRAVKDALILLTGQKEGDLLSITKKLRTVVGNTSNVAAIQMNTLQGKSTKFSSSVNALNISIGELAAGPLGDIIVSFNDVVKSVTSFVKENPALTKTLFWVAVTVLVATHALQGLLAVIGMFFAAKGILALAYAFGKVAIAAITTTTAWLANTAAGVWTIATAKALWAEHVLLKWAFVKSTAAAWLNVAALRATGVSAWFASTPLLVIAGTIVLITAAITLAVAAIAELIASFKDLEILNGLKGMAQFDQENFTGASILKILGMPIGDSKEFGTGPASLVKHYKGRLGIGAGPPVPRASVASVSNSALADQTQKLLGKIKVEVTGDKEARVTATGEGPLDMILDSGAGMFDLAGGL